MKTPLQVLKEYWGYTAFRPMQVEIIQSVLDGKDTLALLPTGGGKSICFQVPALCMNSGLCLVISPLIALMKDQVFQLKKRGIRAAAIFSGMPFREIDIVMDNAIQGAYAFLYLSPERLSTPLFQERCKQMKISMIAVDESHCISQWGYDFRPHYLNICDLRHERSKMPMMALTATATPQVRQDIAEKLELREPEIFVKSFERTNLVYGVRKVDYKLGKLLETLKRVSGSTIVYVRSRKKTLDLSRGLLKNGITATHYHGGLDNSTREKNQKSWMDGEARVMVATNAFGMGIDKPDVRLVAHMDLPETLEDYYQEAGRAGRDEREAYALLIYHPDDTELLLNRVQRSYPSVQAMERVYQALANYFKLAVGAVSFESFDFDLNHFCSVFKMDVTETFYAIRKLQEQGVLHLNEAFTQRPKFMFTVSHQQVYEFEIKHANLEPLIKSLLRLYGGEIYQDLVVIDERKIQKLTQLTRKKIHNYLDYLADSDMGIYEPVKEKPTLTFVGGRYKVNDLPLDKQLLKWRRELSLEKAGKLIDYIGLEKRCRTQFLLSYFGEERNERCGYCDNCVALKRSEPGISRKQIMDLLKEKPGLKAQEVAHSFPDKYVEEVVQTLRKMLDLGLIVYDKDRKLTVPPGN